MERSGRGWRKLDSADEKGEIKRTGEGSRENKKKIKIFIYLGKLHLSPSSIQNLPIKSFNYQFNQFDP